MAFRDRYAVNARVALRLARGLSQRDAADAWNARWPAHPKTFKNFSYWEVWPAKTGHAPSLHVLARLAELYQCQVTDLLTDCPDYRNLDPAHRARRQLARVTGSHGRDIGSSDEPRNGTGAEVPAVNPPGGLAAPLAGWTERLENMDVGELSAMISSWARQVGSAVNRRTMLLKMSAALSLAAADVGVAPRSGREIAPSRQQGNTAATIRGIWHSRYLYHSDGRDQDFESEHYVVFRRDGDQIVGQSLPHTTGSQLTLNLSVSGPVATGSWTERTSPDGYYKGATYYGALQLIINPTGREMSGRWLGFGKSFEVNTGGWDLTWVDGGTSTRAVRAYQFKA